MNYFKRILIIALCSILCICTVPRFSLRSEAASTATYALYQTLLNLSGYLTTRGYSIVHEHGSSIPTITDLQTMTYENMGNLLFDISMKLNAFGATHDEPYLGQNFVNAMSEASFRGSILLSKTTRDLVDLWLQTSNSDGTVEVGTSNVGLDYYASPAFTNFRVDGNSISYFCSVVPVILGNSSTSSSGNVIFFPENIEDMNYNALNNTYSMPANAYSSYYFQTLSVTYDNAIYKFQTSSFSTRPTFLSFFQQTVSGFPTLNQVATMYLDGQFESVPGGSIVTSQITDTSASDLLTSTNTIASDGTVEGDTTIYLPDQSTLETAIDGYNQGTITYEDFLKIFGINSVASDATVQEKEEALTVVVTPSEDYLWFTKTQWGADSLEETRKASAATRAEEDSLADSIAKTANGGSDPEDPDNKSRGKGLLALLLLGLGIWNTPIIAGDGTPSGGGTDDSSGDGSGDTSGYLSESIAGMAIASSLIDDFFDAAGGSDGYGLIYTVGASFVIFSVIIGAANYFGALFHGSDTKQNIKASGKRSTPGKEKKGG